MKLAFFIRKFLLLLLCLCGGSICKAQYTELQELKKDTVFAPLTQLAFEAAPIKLSIIPSNFYTSKFGFFCKQELKIEKAIAVPFKFRVGSVAEVDRMEGKPNTRFTGQ